MHKTLSNASQSANQTMTERGQNASIALNKTAESANAALSEFGKNVTNARKTALNKTVQVAKVSTQVQQTCWVTYHGKYFCHKSHRDDNQYRGN
jgi:hypothetical protein